jgi:hypothetical protein
MRRKETFPRTQTAATRVKQELLMSDEMTIGELQRGIQVLKAVLIDLELEMDFCWTHAQKFSLVQQIKTVNHHIAAMSLILRARAKPKL